MAARDAVSGCRTSASTLGYAQEQPETLDNDDLIDFFYKLIVVWQSGHRGLVLAHGAL